MEFWVLCNSSNTYSLPSVMSQLANERSQHRKKKKRAIQCPKYNTEIVPQGWK